MPFDKLKAPSTAEGLRVDTERRFLPRFENRGLARPNVSNMKKGTLDKKVGGSEKAFGEQFKYDTINHYFHPGLS
jgi:hypothetical protein